MELAQAQENEAIIVFRPSQWSISRQIISTSLLVLCVVSVVGGVLFRSQETWEVQETVAAAQTLTLRLLASALAGPVGDGDRATLERLAGEVVHLDRNIVAIRVVGIGGETLYDWKRAGSIPESASLETALAGDASAGARLRVTWTTSHIHAEVLEHLVNSVTFFVGGLLILTVLLLLMLLRLVVGPLNRLSARLVRIGEGDYAAHPVDVTSREFKVLGSVLNGLCGVLDEQDAVRRRLEGANRAIEELRQRNELILDSAGDGIFGIDAQAHVVFVNKAASRMFGWQSGELVGHPVDRLLASSQEDAHAEAPLLSTLSDGMMHRVDDARFRRWNGGEFPAEYTSTPIRERGAVTGAVIVFRNVSERYLAEQEQRLAASTFDTNEAMLITDPLGTVLRVNRAFCAMSGYGETEVLGRNAGFQKSGRHDRDFYAAMWTALQEHGHWEGEIWNKRRDGEAYPVWYSISAVSNRDGATTHYVAHSTDISRMKRVEEELRAAVVEAQAASRAKAGFLATMSHEIRTPLNAVLGMLGLLADSRLDAEQRSFVHTAQEGGKALLDLISDILDFSKMDAGKLELEASSFDPRRIIESVRTLLVARAAEKRLRFDIELDPALPGAVLGDSGRLRQIMLNLAGNAVKYTPQGHVTVRLERRGGDARNAMLRFSVEDSGVGIPADRHADLFNEFSMVDSSYSRRVGGTGLGLAISQRLVALMGGRIEFTSSEGQGSTFWFDVELPVSERPIEVSSLELPPLPSLRPLRVLLAEDVAANRQVARQMLERAGHHVDTVADGREAVAAVTQFPYDAVLMDISMPEMDGLEATRAIRALPGSAAGIPIVAMTAHAMRGDREAFLEAGMDDYLQKPVVRELMLLALARAVDGRPECEAEWPVQAAGPATEMQQPTAAVDRDVLIQLGRDTRMDLLPELVALFLEDARQRVTRIVAALEVDDDAVIEHETHALGSSAATYGLPGTHDLARRCEHALREGDATTGKALAARLVDEAEAAFVALDAAVGDVAEGDEG